MNKKANEQARKEMQKKFMDSLTKGMKVTYTPYNMFPQSSEDSIERLSFEQVLEIKRAEKDKIFSINKDNVITALDRLGYVSGSKVGLITVKVDIANTLMDDELNEQFLVVDYYDEEDDELYCIEDRVDMRKLKKVFPCINLDAKGKHGYEEIYADKEGDDSLALEYKYNDGRKIKLIKARKDDIHRKFVAQLMKATELKREDLVKIGRDLEKIGRLMQEIEIDSAKKPEIKEGLMEITEFMNTRTCGLASKEVKFAHNYSDISDDVKRNKARRRIPFKWEMEQKDNVVFLHEVSHRLQEYKSSLRKQQLADDVMAERIEEMFELLLTESVIADPAYQVKLKMMSGAEKDIQEIVNRLYDSNMNIFEEFKYVKVDGKDTDSDKLTRFVLLAIEVIHAHFKYKKHSSMTDVEKLSEMLRNAIYTLGNRLKFTKEETFKLAVAAGWKHLKTNKDGLEEIVVGTNFAYTAIENMFTNELKWYFNSDVMSTPVKIEIPQGYAVKMTDMLFMKDGKMEVTLPNGEKGKIVCTEHKKFTGILQPRIIDNKPVFVILDDRRYDYTPVEFAAIDRIADISRKGNIYDMVSEPENRGVLEANRANAAVYLEESDLEGLDGETAEVVELEDAMKFETTIANIDNQINKAVAEKNSYKLGFCRVNNTVHFIAQNLDRKKERVMARVLSDYTTDYQPIGVLEPKMNIYNKITPMLCVKGGILILEK